MQTITEITAYRKQKRDEAARRRQDLSQICGWTDVDGTFIATKEEWDEVKGLPGFRLETETDRKRRRWCEDRHPQEIEDILQTIHDELRY